MGVGLYLCYEWKLISKRWFRFRSSRLICTFQFQLRWTEQGAWGRGEHLCSAEKEGQKKMAYLERAVCTFHTAAGPPPPLLTTTPSLSPPFCPSFSPSLLSPAPAERLTRADEKGSSVKGQCWAATPRMPAPVQSNKAGCPPVTGCLGGKTGSFLPLCLSVH